MRGRRILVVAVVTVAAVAAVTAASSTSGLSLTGVAANTKSDGYAPASRLSPELTQVVVAQGSTKLENPSALTSYYGYDNDVVNAAGEPQMVPTPTSGPTAKPRLMANRHSPNAATRCSGATTSAIRAAEAGR